VEVGVFRKDPYGGRQTDATKTVPDVERTP